MFDTTSTSSYSYHQHVASRVVYGVCCSASANESQNLCQSTQSPGTFLGSVHLCCVFKSHAFEKFLPNHFTAPTCVVCLPISSAQTATKLFLSAQFHLCLSYLRPAHQNAPHTKWKHTCMSLIVQWLRLWPLPCDLHPHPFLSLLIHLPLHFLP